MKPISKTAKKQCVLFHYVVLCPEPNKWRLAAKEVICFVLNWLSKEAEARASIHSYIYTLSSSVVYSSTEKMQKNSSKQWAMQCDALSNL